MQALMQGVSHKLFDAAASAQANSSAAALLPRASLVTWQSYFGTNPASVTLQIQTSNDGDNWDVTAATTTVTGSLATFQTSAKFIRARIEAISGGDDVTVEVVAKPL